jgi:RNA polymerase sigma-70 factor (ECF subfamily)
MPSAGGPPAASAEFEREALGHLDSLYNFAMWMTRRRPDAEDLVQETYLKAFRAAHQFAPGTDLRAWLFTIMRNTYLNLVRRKGLEWREPEGEDGPPASGGEPFGAAERLLLRTLVRDEIDAALDKLPPAYRMAIVLADLEGLSLAQAGQVLGCPVGTVKSRLARGRELLRGYLRDYAPPRRTDPP